MDIYYYYEGRPESKDTKNTKTVLFKINYTTLKVPI